VTWPLQAEVLLAALGAQGAEVGELLAYNESAFDLAALAEAPALPLADEPSVAFWEARVAEARERGAVAVLREHLPQLHFPIRAGMSASAGYLAATRRGEPPEGIAEATGLDLPHPELVELDLHASPAGRVPVLVARGRAEFVALHQALGGRNEPRPVADSQGALALSGYVNWSRVRQHRAAWERGEVADPAPTWAEEMARLRARPELYQDRLILLSDGPYSAVPAAAMGLSEEAWRPLSLAIRRDHESAHYFTKRLFGSMRNRLLDELLADYAGIVGAAGRFRADWLLRFLGLEDFPRFRPGGRLAIYRGDPPLSDGAFQVLGALACAAAASLERFDAHLEDRLRDRPRSALDRAVALAAIASHRAEELAAPDGADRLTRTYRDLAARFGAAAGG
jgi:hypothetical protein